ncbi:jerky-like protein [Trichonephila clavipes]|nr:jerky-like protein [Trichonephila clavipes]
MDQGVIEKLQRIYRKQAFRRLLLTENDEESVATFAKKLTLKDSFYMLAEAWNSLEGQSLKNAWDKLQPDLGEKHFNDDHKLPQCFSNCGARPLGGAVTLRWWREHIENKRFKK